MELINEPDPDPDPQAQADAYEKGIPYSALFAMAKSRGITMGRALALLLDKDPEVVPPLPERKYETVQPPVSPEERMRQPRPEWWPEGVPYGVRGVIGA